MAVRTLPAFAAGVACGWVARSALGSTREAVVRALVLTRDLRERVRRMCAEQIELVQDLFAEGRARSEREEPPLDEDAPPRVVDVRGADRSA